MICASELWIFFRKLVNKKAPEILPHENFIVIGDIHGSFNYLLQLVSICGDFDHGARLVFAGDYIDRGEQSAEVLEFLSSMDFPLRPEPVFLLGNHEEMLLEFLHGCDNVLPDWLSVGGDRTLASFGMDVMGQFTKDLNPQVIRAVLKNRISPRISAWLSELRPIWASGNVLVSHAGRDGWHPSLNRHRGASPTLGDLGKNSEVVRKAVWSVEGHSIVPLPSIVGQRIFVDTGAYASGRLSAAHISSRRLVFLSSNGDVVEHKVP